MAQPELVILYDFLQVGRLTCMGGGLLCLVGDYFL